MADEQEPMQAPEQDKAQEELARRETEVALRERRLTAKEPMQAPEQDKAQDELARRETEVALRERRLTAKEELARRGLDAGLLSHLDLSSDEALMTGLNLAAHAAARPSIPRDAAPNAPAPDSYRERAKLYLQDPQAYRLMASNGRSN